MPSDNYNTKRDHEPATPMMAMSDEQFAKLVTLMQQSGSGGMDHEKFATALAEANRKANRPENPVSPGISAFNPQGDRDHPKPALKVKMICAGYPLEVPTLDVEEVTLLNQLKPGRFMVSKSDGSTIPFDVLPRFNTLGDLDELHLSFPCKTLDQRTGLLGLKPMLREIVSGKPEAIQIADLLAENLRLRQMVPASALG